jgi:hypothetical protein
MITGAHSIIFSSNPDADRAFFRDVLALPHVDVGGGWLIFGLPPAEVAVHDAEETAGKHELYLMCDDIESFIADVRQREIECTEVENAGWGLMTQVTLPGGGKLGVYQPRHARPETDGVGERPEGAARKASKKASKKGSKKGSKKSAKKVGKSKPAVGAVKAKKKAKKKR